MRLSLQAQIIQKRLGARAGVSHAFIQHQIGEVLIAEKLRLGAPQLEYFED
jgi:hypothetical protein